MSDINTVWDQKAGRGDYVLAGADLQTGEDLRSAILISLFSDRTSQPADLIPDGSTDRRGWWGDEAETYQIGSRLWLLERSKLTKQVALSAADFAREALQWMIDDGIAADFGITTQIRNPDQLWMRIIAFRSAGGVTAKNYAWVWEGVAVGPSAGPASSVIYLATEGGDILTTEDGLQFVLA